MTLENFRDICAQQILPPRSHSLNKSTYEAKVAAPMAATFEGRPMYGRLTGTKISYGELAHVANDLAMRKMQTGLPLTDQRGVRDHCEGDGCAGCILEVDDLRRGDAVCA